MKRTRRKNYDVPTLKRNKKRNSFYISFHGKKIYMGARLADAKKNLIHFIDENCKKESNVVDSRKTKNHVTITDLVLAVLQEKYFPESTMFRARIAFEKLNDNFGSDDVETFGPVALKRIREEWIQEGKARSYIQDLEKVIKRLFRFGVENELVSETVAAKLMYVKPIREGEARDNPPREDVKDAEILKTLPYLLPTVRDMVVLQRISGMRPSELFRMTKEQFLKMEGDVWIYAPFKFKTKIHSKSRIIGFGAYEIGILKKYMDIRKPDEPFFSPQDTWKERARRLGVKESRNRNIGNSYNRYSYNENIHRTIERANAEMKAAGRPESDLIEPWTPYQLRHAAATFLSLLMDENAAATALGHSSTKTTRIYDHSAVAKVEKFIQERDKAGGQNLNADSGQK